MYGEQEKREQEKQEKREPERRGLERRAPESRGQERLKLLLDVKALLLSEMVRDSGRRVNG